VRARTTQDGDVTLVRRRFGRRAPLAALVTVLLALSLLPVSTLASGWTRLGRVSDSAGSRLDSLHQLAASGSSLHLIFPRIGPRTRDDRVVYQRSSDGGRHWTSERTIFRASRAHRTVVPNLALAARGSLVAAVWRVKGPQGHALFARVSRDGGASFGRRLSLFETGNPKGIGVPAVAIGDGFMAVAWSNRANGQVKLRVSRDGGRSFGSPRTLGSSQLSIDCQRRLTDALVGLAANGRSLHVAWSWAPSRRCVASAIRVRTSLDRGRSWSPQRTITRRETFGWPELDARGKTVVATVQSTSGGLVVASSTRNGRRWTDRLLKAPSGRNFAAADVAILPHRKVWVSYVNERLGKGHPVATKLVARRSTDSGVTYKAPMAVTREQALLRMAPNIAFGSRGLTIVVQSGPLDGSPRNLYAWRRR
jgi:hypothetical protein